MKKTNALRLLDKYKIQYQLLEYQYHPENLDLKKIATDNNFDVALIHKTLVLFGDKNGVFVAIVPSDQTLNLKAAAKVSGNKKVHLLPVKNLQAITGYIRGGCSPFGMKKNFPTYADKGAESLDLLYVNAGVRGILVGLSASDLAKAARVDFVDIC